MTKETEKLIEYNHQPNSIEISRNAKGEYAWKIKVYYGQVWIRALEILDTINQSLKKKYLEHE